MSDDLIELLDNTLNCAVVKLQSRKYPGVVIQGDSLHILYTSVQYAKTLCETGQTAEATDELSMLVDILAAYVNNYERVLKQYGSDLPYMQD
jgi:hypothetical protein